MIVIALIGARVAKAQDGTASLDDQIQNKYSEQAPEKAKPAHIRAANKNAVARARVKFERTVCLTRFPGTKFGDWSAVQILCVG